VLALRGLFREEFCPETLAFALAPGVGVFADLRGELFLAVLAVSRGPRVALLQSPLLDVGAGREPVAGLLEGLLAELVDEALL
jgi:hypothetical protein